MAFGPCSKRVSTRNSLFLWIFVVVSRVRSIFRVTTTNQEVARSSRAGRTKTAIHSITYSVRFFARRSTWMPIVT